MTKCLFSCSHCDRLVVPLFLMVTLSCHIVSVMSSLRSAAAACCVEKLTDCCTDCCSPAAERESRSLIGHWSGAGTLWLDSQCWEKTQLSYLTFSTPDQLLVLGGWTMSRTRMLFTRPTVLCHGNKKSKNLNWTSAILLVLTINEKSSCLSSSLKKLRSLERW